MPARGEPSTVMEHITAILRRLRAIERRSVAIPEAATVFTGQHDDLAGVTANQHHNQSHSDAQHTDGPNSKPGHTHSVAHADLTGVTANQHHNQSHSVSDHTTAVNVQDEGVDAGAALTLNFAGAGVSASVAAGTATITIPGGGGGSGDEPSAADWML